MPPLCCFTLKVAPDCLRLFYSQTHYRLVCLWVLLVRAPRRWEAGLNLSVPISVVYNPGCGRGMKYRYVQRAESTTQWCDRFCSAVRRIDSMGVGPWRASSWDVVRSIGDACSIHTGWMPPQVQVSFFPQTQELSFAGPLMSRKIWWGIFGPKWGKS